jgi:hypothetical protein
MQNSLWKRLRTCRKTAYGINNTSRRNIGKEQMVQIYSRTTYTKNLTYASRQKSTKVAAGEERKKERKKKKKKLKYKDVIIEVDVTCAGDTNSYGSDWKQIMFNVLRKHPLSTFQGRNSKRCSISKQYTYP